MEHDANPFWFSRIPTSAPWHSVPRRGKKIQAQRLRCQVFKDSSHRTKAWEAASRCLQMGRGSWCWCTCSCVEPALQLKAAVTGFPWASKRKALKQLTSEFDSIWSSSLCLWARNADSILFHNVLDQCLRSRATWVPPYHNFKHLPP